MVELLRQRGSFAKLVRLTQHRHSSEDIHVIFYRKAVVIPTMRHKDDLNDN